MSCEAQVCLCTGRCHEKDSEKNVVGLLNLVIIDDEGKEHIIKLSEPKPIPHIEVEVILE